MLIQKISPHLKKLAKNCPEIEKEFYRSEEEELFKEKDFLDPLLEEKFTPVKGLIHKYSNRVLILLTMKCASYCRFCTRRRTVSEIKKGKISPKDLEEMINYVKSHSEIKEIILSGGDPFMVPQTLRLALKKFSSLPQIKVIRIGTRVPVSNPRLVTDDLLNTFSKIKQPLYVMIHFEHPNEITSLTIKAIEKLRKAGAILFSQTVFLKGVNDKVEILEELFTRLIEIGVKPYYIFHCDPVVGTKHFWVKIEKEIEIMTELRKRLSGLAYPLYVIDVPHGFGKIPVPLKFWEFSLTHYKDFEGKEQKII
ncbi:MAG: KamA family radical SAM protein [Microgenomates group bacterium]